MNFDNDNVIYTTGLTPDGTPLIGGVWTLRDQEGFSLEMAYMICRDKGWAVDWMEAMADASHSNNLPAFMAAVESFLPAEEVNYMKLRFAFMVRTWGGHEVILASKRGYAHALAASLHA